MIEDNLHLRNPKSNKIFMPAQNQPPNSALLHRNPYNGAMRMLYLYNDSAPRYASYSSHVISG